MSTPASSRGQRGFPSAAVSQCLSWLRSRGGGGGRPPGGGAHRSLGAPTRLLPCSAHLHGHDQNFLAACDGTQAVHVLSLPASTQWWASGHSTAARRKPPCPCRQQAPHPPARAATHQNLCASGHCTPEVLSVTVSIARVAAARRGAGRRPPACSEPGRARSQITALNPRLEAKPACGAPGAAENGTSPQTMLCTAFGALSARSERYRK